MTAADGGGDGGGGGPRRTVTGSRRREKRTLGPRPALRFAGTLVGEGETVDIKLKVAESYTAEPVSIPSMAAMACWRMRSRWNDSSSRQAVRRKRNI